MDEFLIIDSIVNMFRVSKHCLVFIILVSMIRVIFNKIIFYIKYYTFKKKSVKQKQLYRMYISMDIYIRYISVWYIICR
jgi:hypothetical protein